MLPDTTCPLCQGPHTLDHCPNWKIPVKNGNWRRGTGLRFKLMAWFTANPGEFLTRDDVAERFGCTKRYATVALSTLKCEGVLTSAVTWTLNPDRDQLRSALVKELPQRCDKTADLFQEAA